MDADEVCKFIIKVLGYHTCVNSILHIGGSNSENKGQSAVL